MVLPTWGAKMPPGLDKGANGSWKFIVFGDTRGDNSAANVNSTKDGYKDGGINKPVLIDMVRAMAAENPAFVLVVGDLATKWTVPMLGYISSNALMARELADWGDIWNTNSGGPVFPVGNQEWNASVDVWTNWIQTMQDRLA